MSKLLKLANEFVATLSANMQEENDDIRVTRLDGGANAQGPNTKKH